MERRTRSFIALQSILGLAAIAMASNANAVPIVTYTFDLPSTGLNSQDPPYPAIATLTLEQIGDDVVFILDPNEINPSNPNGNEGFAQNQKKEKDNSIIKDISFVFDDLGLGLPTLQFVSGPVIDGFSLGGGNIQSGYASNALHLNVSFQDKNSDNDRFTVDKISSWTILNTALTQYTDPFATANNKPSPTFGVISVAPFSHPTNTPNTSNWVAGNQVADIPEPASLALLGIGLTGLLFARRRHSGS